MKLNKKNIIWIVAIFVVIIVVVCLVVFGSKAKHDKLTYEDKLLNLASNYYTSSYYPGLEDINALENFTDIGLNISLELLNSYKKIPSSVKLILDNSKCDYSTSKVVIYPKAPFKAKSFDIELVLDCKEEIK